MKIFSFVLVCLLLPSMAWAGEDCGEPFSRDSKGYITKNGTYLYHEDHDTCRAANALERIAEALEKPTIEVPLPDRATGISVHYDYPEEKKIDSEMTFDPYEQILTIKNLKVTTDECPGISGLGDKYFVDSFGHRVCPQAETSVKK